MKLVYVEWVDSSSLDRVWNSESLIRECSVCRCRSVGWIVHETEDHLTIAGHSDGDEHWSGEMTIPKAAIKRRKILKGP